MRRAIITRISTNSINTGNNGFGRGSTIGRSIVSSTLAFNNSNNYNNNSYNNNSSNNSNNSSNNSMIFRLIVLLAAGAQFKSSTYCDNERK